jgi:hypothetical protein
MTGDSWTRRRTVFIAAVLTNSAFFTAFGLTTIPVSKFDDERTKRLDRRRIPTPGNRRNASHAKLRIRRPLFLSIVLEQPGDLRRLCRSHRFVRFCSALIVRPDLELTPVRSLAEENAREIARKHGGEGLSAPGSNRVNLPRRPACRRGSRIWGHSSRSTWARGGRSLPIRLRPMTEDGR